MSINPRKSHMANFCEILMVQICDFEILGQGHGEQHSQRSQSMANINLYKSHTRFFSSGSHRLRDIHSSEFVTFKM